MNTTTSLRTSGRAASSRLVVFAVLLGALTVVSTAHAQSVAVLPLQCLKQCKPENATFIEGKLLRELKARDGVALVTGDRVMEAMRAEKASSTDACDTDCLVRIGRRLKVDRVIAPTLSLQRKEQSVGTVWIWKNRQVNVPKGVDWGTHQRMCMCHPDTWNRIAENQVTRMLTYDPAKVLRLETSAPKPGAIREENGMVFVPAGPFIMGFRGGEFDEEPRHRVQLDAFWLDKTEVTNAAYNRCVEARKCRRQRYWHRKDINQPQQPVVAVSWKNAVQYCSWAGKRLPTEAEWEKAARGTDERLFPWGNEFDPMKVNMHHARDGFAATAPVGSFPQNASPYGALDMSGNAWEWTADYWGPRYYRHSPGENPTGPKSGVKRVMRGGSWMYDVPFFMTTHNRSPGRPWVRKEYVGFRCAKDASDGQ